MAKGGMSKPKMRRNRERLGEVARDGAGNVTMIRFSTYKDNPLAPTALVSKVGGIFRVDTHLIRVTFIDDVPNAEGVMETVAQGHLIWKTAADWIATREIFQFAMKEFQDGTFMRRRQDMQ